MLARAHRYEWQYFESELKEPALYETSLSNGEILSFRLVYRYHPKGMVVDMAYQPSDGFRFATSEEEDQYKAYRTVCFNARYPVTAPLLTTALLCALPLLLLVSGRRGWVWFQMKMERR